MMSEAKSSHSPNPKQVAAGREKQLADGNRLLWLDAERRPGRIGVELLNCIAKLQDPATCPVVLYNSICSLRSIHSIDYSSLRNDHRAHRQFCAGQLDRIGHFPTPPCPLSDFQFMKCDF